MSTAIAIQELACDEYYVDTPSVRLCVREYGDPEGIPVVMIMGLGCQMTHWPTHLLESLVDAPIRLICFDNRDAGLSSNIRSNLHVNTRLAFLSHKLGVHPKANYTLYDLAADTSHLITALDLGPAHVVGVSMGGMVAQILASQYANLVASLTVIMSSTNSPKLPLPEVNLMLKLGLAGKPPKTKEEQIQRWIGFWKAIQSPRYPTRQRDIEAMVRAGFDRNYTPAGTLRQLQAILATGSLGSCIRRIRVPTQIIHGKHDPLLKPDCARAIAKRIPGSKLHIIDGMGHDLPEQLSPVLATLIQQQIMSVEGGR